MNMTFSARVAKMPCSFVGQIVQRYIRLIDLVAWLPRTVGLHLYDNGAVVVLLLLRILWRLRHQGVKPVRRDRHNHHENDEQHQHDVDQRSDIDVGGNAAATTSCH